LAASIFSLLVPTVNGAANGVSATGTHHRGLTEENCIPSIRGRFEGYGVLRQRLRAGLVWKSHVAHHADRFL
jgi:hypothetical protein